MKLQQQGQIITSNLLPFCISGRANVAKGEYCVRAYMGEFRYEILARNAPGGIQGRVARKVLLRLVRAKVVATEARDPAAHGGDQQMRRVSTSQNMTVPLRHLAVTTSAAALCVISSCYHLRTSNNA